MDNNIEVTSPPISYTDYCIMYRKIKGTIKGCLKLGTFCNRLNGGKTVLITDSSKPVYRKIHGMTPIRIVFKKNNSK